MNQSHSSLEEAYKALLKISPNLADGRMLSLADGECQIPVVDLLQLSGKRNERTKCIKALVDAARSLGIFQIVNHGIPLDARQQLLDEAKVSFNRRNIENKCHRRGNPQALAVGQLQWSEAFHISLRDNDAKGSLRSSVESFATYCIAICETLAEILSRNLGAKSVPNFFEDNCNADSCYVRINRYPRCPFQNNVLGMLPHSDSDFLTILHHERVYGLEILSGGKWLAAKSYPNSLIVIVGDLFQAYSNDAYMGVKHRVVASEGTERFSAAFFYCPKDETQISSCLEPSAYRQFTFEDYRRQTKKDLEATGNKVGLSRFILKS